MGCHATEAEALEQQAALYAEEGDMPKDMPDDKDMDYAGKTAPWRGPLAIEGQVTGDGREFARKGWKPGAVFLHRGGEDGKR